VVADALLTGESQLGLAPFTEGLSQLDPRLKKDVDAAVESIAAAVVPGFVVVGRHPSIEVRTRAVEILARRPEAEAQAALVDALGDREETVQRAVLSAIGHVPSQALVDAAAKLVSTSDSWSLRVRAAEALGRLGAGAAEEGCATCGGRAAAFDALSAAARTDSYALVREAAARALAAIDRERAGPTLDELSRHDPEPSVRKVAAALLASP
jgi:HEAT repeat protein